MDSFCGSFGPLRTTAGRKRVVEGVRLAPEDPSYRDAWLVRAGAGGPSGLQLGKLRRAQGRSWGR